MVLCKRRVDCTNKDKLNLKKVLEKTDRECRTYCDFDGRSICRMHFVESKDKSVNQLSQQTYRY